jgi:hypothetical protein
MVFKLKENKVKIKCNQQNQAPNISADKGNTTTDDQNLQTGLAKSSVLSSHI